MNSYDLSRKWFDWSFENPERINPNHTALYFFIIEHCNRLGWKEKFGLPTTMAKEAIGIRSYNTYINTLNDLVEFGFVKLIEKSKNQYSSNIVALSNFNKAPDKALDKAMIKHGTKQHKSTDSINKQETINNKEDIFNAFWKLYDKQIDRKKCYDKFCKLTDEEIKLIFEKLPDYIRSTPEKQFRKNPTTWLNGKCWNDIEYSKPQTITYKQPRIIID
jgi:hypothetical protein